MAYTTIDDPTIYFITNLRSGLYGGSDTAFDIGFQPDWIWNKKRSGSGVHSLFDSVRGFGSSGKVLYSNTTGTEATNALIKSVSSTGFTVTASSDDTGTMVDWCWKAGGSASSNSNGSITSSVSANTTAGFSIVSYASGQSGAFSIGHGLSSAPKMFIAKSRDQGHSWGFYYTVRGTNTNWMTLDTTDAQGNNSADPDANGIAAGGAGHTGVFAILNSSTISIGPTAYANSGTSAIGYCFVEVKGYSKFGTFTGNQNTDGTFIYTGFKPAWVMFKEATGSATGDNWFMYDNKRSTFNQTQKYLRANLSNDEQDNSAGAIDMLSNGFKIRTSDTSLNDNGETYIFMAFAESPFVNSNGVPNNAR